VVLLGMLDVPEVPMPVLPVAAPVSVDVPPAPIEVPEPVEPVLEPVVLEPMEPVVLALVSVLGVVVVLGVVLALVSVEGVVVDGVVVDGLVLEVDDDVEVSVDVEAASSFLPQADRVRAAIRARAAHCAIGDLIIRNSLRISFRSERAGSGSRCLRLTLVRLLPHLVVCHCRRL
jgi:hypothetical protein